MRRAIRKHRPESPRLTMQASSLQLAPQLRHLMPFLKIAALTPDDLAVWLDRNDGRAGAGKVPCDGTEDRVGPFAQRGRRIPQSDRAMFTAADECDAVRQ